MIKFYDFRIKALYYHRNIFHQYPHLSFLFIEMILFLFSLHLPQFHAREFWYIRKITTTGASALFTTLKESNSIVRYMSLEKVI